MKKLTVPEKKYLMERIEAIVSNKSSAITAEYQPFDASPQEGNMFKAVLEGKIKLRSPQEILKRIQAIVDAYEEKKSQNPCYGYHSCRNINNFDVIDEASANKHREAIMEKGKKARIERDERLAKLREAAIALKDEIMLGDGTPDALKKFETTKF